IYFPLNRAKELERTDNGAIPKQADPAIKRLNIGKLRYLGGHAIAAAAHSTYGSKNALLNTEESPSCEIQAECIQRHEGESTVSVLNGSRCTAIPGRKIPADEPFPLKRLHLEFPDRRRKSDFLRDR